LGHALPPAPSSSPAKIASPSSRSKRRKLKHANDYPSPSSSPDDMPLVSPSLAHDTTATPPSDTTSPILGIGHLSTAPGGSPSTL
jgi:hypothetical protein